VLSDAAATAVCRAVAGCSMVHSLECMVGCGFAVDASYLQPKSRNFQTKCINTIVGRGKEESVNKATPSTQCVWYDQQSRLGKRVQTMLY
jgi:hypothetical protein